MLAGMKYLIYHNMLFAVSSFSPVTGGETATLTQYGFLYKANIEPRFGVDECQISNECIRSV
jgi:hypothetical protein